MRTVCEKDKCAGCMACVDACTHDAIAVQDGIWAYNAIIDPEKCVNCGLCERVCQQLHPASLREPLEWQQGWSSDPEERLASSSGGAAAAISKAFVQHGGLVCSCAFRNGRFGFEVAGTVEDLRRFKGSKYVKSDPSGAYREVRALLRKGRKVLFIGLPCQVSSMRNFCRDDANLYTIDLICHGTPSPKILERFLEDQGIAVRNASNIEFRKKTRFFVQIDDGPVDVPGVTDRYSIAFLNGLDYTDNCYECSYARVERVSDVTLGDSWGTDLANEAPSGVSLMICQTEKGKELLEISGLALLLVNIQTAVDNNGQLSHPSKQPHQRQHFFQDFNRGAKVVSAVNRAFPSQCLKQEIKKVLIKAGLRRTSDFF